VLLILATTPDPLAAVLYRLARELGLEVVVEIHTRQELDRALALSPTIIGINNRDILSLETDSGDVRVTEELAPLVPRGIVKISESSLQTGEDIQRAIEAGADAVLVGTAILKADDPVTFLSRLFSGVRV
jgi:indole-3-glycerol phosphate synthase